MTIIELLNTNIQLSSNKLSIRKRYEFFNNLSVLISTGVQIKEAIQIIDEELKQDKDLKKNLHALSQNLTEGKLLSESMQFLNKFSDFEVYSIRLGEETGMLSQSLSNLSDYLKNILELKRKIISALSYPIIILFTSIIAIIFMLNFVVPMFTDIFQRFGKELPPLTKLMISISDNSGSFIIIFLFILLVINIIHRLLRGNPIYLHIMFSIILKIPVVGKLIIKANLAKFTSAMELFTSSGVPITKAINLIQQMLKFYPLQIALKNIEKSLIEGDSLHIAIKKEKIFDSRMIAMIKVGIEVNQLELIFKKLKLNYNEELTYQTTILNSIIEPIMIIFIGIIVATILIAMYLPIFQLSNTFSI